jgi:serine protease Do
MKTMKKRWIALGTSLLMVPFATGWIMETNATENRAFLEVATPIDYASLYAATVTSSVSVLNYGSTGTVLQGIGSGVVYRQDLQGYYVITNHHVVDGGTSFEVILSTKQRVSATLLGSDDDQDVAVLRLSTLANVTVATIDWEDVLLPGEEVFAIGTPGEIDFAFTMTKGIVAGVDRDVDLDENVLLHQQTHAIQIDVAVNPGNSGGPLFNSQGKLIGINSLKLTSDGYRAVQGLNFALPIHDMFLAAESIRTRYQSPARLGTFVRPTLGDHQYRSVLELTYHERYEIGLPADIRQGVFLQDVVEGTNALATAGIHDYDVITSWNGIAVRDKVHLRQLLYAATPSTQVQLTIRPSLETGYGAATVKTITVASS